MAIVLITTLSLALVPTVLADHLPSNPSERQSLQNALWGAKAVDFWTGTCTAKDTLDVTFIFLSPDSSDTLDAIPSGGIFTTSVACTLQCSGDSSATDFIDRSKFPVEAYDSWVIPARVKSLHIIMSAAGRARAFAIGD